MKHPVLSNEENTLIYGHSQRDGKRSIITISLGQGPQTRNKTQLLVANKGHMIQQGVVDCDRCKPNRLDKWLQNGPYGHWLEGNTVKEKHWNHSGNNPNSAVGLRIQCVYSAYLDLLEKAHQAYEQYSDINDSSLAIHGRAALVRVDWKDVMSVSMGRLTGSRLEQFPPVVLMATKIKVLDLIDQLPLIPSIDVIKEILAAPPSWHTKWHESFDARPIKSFRDFPANVTATLQAAGNWSTEQNVSREGPPDDAKISPFQNKGVEELSEDIKNALVGLAMAGSWVEFLERGRNSHALAKVQADALVEKSNSLPEESSLNESVGSALAELVFAMSQAETYAFKKDPPMFEDTPAKVQGSWMAMVRAAVNDEASALARALVVYRRLHGLER